ncbi:MAG: DUF4139 domain-containing protein [Chitinophagales bacterium]|nr:DUF4139 domain-containing protein [Chitinophagales bacterium]
MRYILTTITVLFTLALFAENEVKITATVDKATIFLSGAQLYHSGNISLPAGESMIVMEGVANSLDALSIQAGGTGNYVITDVQYRLWYPEPVNNQQIPSDVQKKIDHVQDSLLDISFQLKSIYNQREVLEIQKTMLLNNQILIVNSGIDSLPLLQQSIEYYDKKLNAIYAELLLLEKKELLINKESTKLQTRLYELQNYWQQKFQEQNPNQPRPQVLVSVIADQATTGKIEINYITYNAGWYATYDIRATEISLPVELTYRANIWQQTGIDWKNVKLTCSTGNPLLNNTIPVLNSWYLGYYQEIYQELYDKDYGEDVNVTAPSSAEANDLQKKTRIYLDEKPAQSAADYTQQNMMLATTEFEVKLNYTIPSDGKGHAVALQTKQLKSDYSYLIVPKIDAGAFLIAKITEWENISLLPGIANIYFRNTYMGKTNINPLALNDTLQVSLGRDNSIEVKRTQIADKSKDRIIGTNNTKTLAYEIEVRNGKANEIEIVVKDHIPVSQDDDIKVEVTDIDGGLLDENTGIVTWAKKLKPKEKETYQLEFEITYPKNKQPATL